MGYVYEWEQECCKKPREIYLWTKSFLCVSRDLPDLFFTYFCSFSYALLSILAALFSPPVVLLSIHSFCFLETPPRFLLFQNFRCCFLVFPGSVSQRQKIWFAFLMYLYLWVEYVLFSCPIMDKLGEDIKHIHPELSYVKDFGLRRNGAIIN